MLHARLAELATLGATEHGIDRGLFTAAERAARERFVAWARADGLHVEQDRVGNVFAQLAGRDHGPPVQCGSHLDTVRGGGALDGAYGVVAGLEALRRIAAAGEPPARGLEAVAWAGEEGSRFPVGCLGSSVYAGLMPFDEAAWLLADDGETFAAALRGRYGLLPGVPVRDGFPPPAAYVELHIEQGSVMERSGARLGIVSAIAGQRRYHITIDGVAGHAGTLPMVARADALCTASEIVLAVEEAARSQADTVATVGYLTVEPNQTNVVPGRVELRIDLRSADDARLEVTELHVRTRAEEIASQRGTRVTFDTIEARPSAPMEERMRSLARAACLERDPKTMTLHSGAGHDAMCISRIAPAAMIFVPSIGGRSHVGEERTSPEDLDLGVDALEATLRAAADMIGGASSAGGSER
jgi:hydantoinase/carbamoylase family amidase